MDVVISASITTLIALLGYVPQKRKLKGLQTAIQLDEKSIAGDYVYIEGVVENSTTDYNTQFAPTKQSGPLYQLITEKVSSKWDSLFLEWTNKHETISTIYYHSPFCIRPKTMNSILVGILHVPSSATKLSQAGCDLYTVNTQFTHPPESNLASSVFDYVTGDRLIGFQTTEKLLPLGSNFTIAGQLANPENITNWKKQPHFCLTPPPSGSFFSSSNPKPYILTTSSWSDYLTIERRQLRVWSTIFYTSLFVTLALISRHLYRKYKLYKDRQTMKQMLKDLRKSKTNGSDPFQENMNENECCLICLERKRNCCFIPCGHIVSCMDCIINRNQFDLVFGSQSDNNIGSGNLKFTNCPVCRCQIDKVVQTFS